MSRFSSYLTFSIKSPKMIEVLKQLGFKFELSEEDTITESDMIITPDGEKINLIYAIGEGELDIPKFDLDKSVFEWFIDMFIGCDEFFENCENYEEYKMDEDIEKCEIVGGYAIRDGEGSFCMHITVTNGQKTVSVLTDDEWNYRYGTVLGLALNNDEDFAKLADEYGNKQIQGKNVINKKTSSSDQQQEWQHSTLILSESITKAEPMTVKSIDRYMGDKTEIIIPDNIDGYPVYEISYNAFRNNKMLTSVVIPPSVCKICDHAFENCSNLKRVIILGEKMEIGTSVFCGCKELEEIVFPYEHTTFESHSFQGCRKLTDESGFVVLGPANYRILYDCQLPITAKELWVPDGVVKIAKRAFSVEYMTYDTLKRIVLPNSMKEIGYAAFEGNVSLEQVVLPDGLERIDERAFCGCVRLNDIYIPESVTELGKNAFFNFRSKIRGSVGSIAEKYAKENGYTFLPCQKNYAEIILESIRKEKNAYTSFLDEFEFCERSFVTTGLNDQQEEKVKKLVLSHGGYFKTSVSKKTNYLIINPDFPYETKKHIDTKEWISKGVDIKIIPFTVFLDLAERYFEEHSDNK